MTNRRRKGRFHRSILPHTVWEPQPHWLIIDRLGLMDPARRKGCPSGESRSPAEPGEYKVPSSHQNVLYISTTPTNGGENEGSPGRYRPARSVNPNPIADADWLGRVKGARGEDYPSKQRRGPAEPVEYKVPSPDRRTRGRKWRSHGSIPPRTVWKTQPHWLITGWLGLMDPA